jgi:flagellar motor switch protein FliN
MEEIIKKNTEKKDNLKVEYLYDVKVSVSVVLGSAVMSLSELLKLNKGAVLELDRMIGEPVDVCVNNKPVARGEIVVVDNKIGISLTEIIS